MIRRERERAGRQRSAAPRPHWEFVPGQFILRFAASALPRPPGESRLAFAARTALAVPEAVGAPIDWLHRQYGIKWIEPVFSDRGRELRRAGLRAAPLRARLAVQTSVFDSDAEELRGITIVTTRAGAVPAEALRRLRAAKAVEFAEPMPARWLQADPVPDPKANRQWGLRAINWFRIDPAADNVTLGVMDTGVDRGHPDLKDVVARYEHEGTVADDLLAHGTHVCGIAAAAVNNGVGISGVARCRLAVWKIFDDRPAADGEFYVNGTAYLRALKAAAESGLRVLNLSIGGTARSRTEEILFARLERADVAVCAAMGNEHRRGNPVEYPAAYPGVLAVGAVNESLRRSDFSNTGPHLGLVAPGSNILSTVPTQASRHMTATDYDVFSGTSMAAPHVAGAAALVAAKRPDWNAARIKAHLVATAAKLPEMKKRARTDEHGAGLLDLAAALG